MDRKKKTLPKWLCAVLLALCLTACTPAAPTSPASTQATLPSGQYNPVVGQVRIYTCDETLYQAFTTLAEEYYQLTRFPVQVQLAQGDCREALEAALDTEEAPTLFCLHSREALEILADSLYDLTDSRVVQGLVNPAFAMEWEGKLLAVTADTQGFGLIYNASLLARVGFTRSDITNFTHLQLVSQYITQQLHFDPFPAPDLENTAHRDMACLLLSISESEEALRAFWELYTQNYTPAVALDMTAFLEGRSTFCLGGTWEYEELEALGSANLDILPAFTPVSGELSYTAELCWAVNGEASKVDIQRTLEFLAWLVTARDGKTAPVEALGLFSPFADAVSYDNPLEKKLREYMRLEGARVVWGCCGLDEEALAALSQALADYEAEPTQEKWEALAALLPKNFG